MEDEDIDPRHAAAYHAAAQAVMAFYLGGWVNDEGIEISFDVRYRRQSNHFHHSSSDAFYEYTA